MQVMKEYLRQYDFFRYKELDVKDRLSVLFYVAGAVLASMGFLLGILFGMSFWMNIPHAIIAILCLIFPFVYKNNVSYLSIIMIPLIAYLYFPFVFFTNGGNSGAAPIYFLIAIVYFSFYLKKKQVIRYNMVLILYYAVIMTYAHINPEIVIPYPDEINRVIDLIVAVSAVGAVLSLAVYTAFDGYNEEHKKTAILMNELEERNIELEYISTHDSLTKAHTRRFFLERLKEEIDYAKENGERAYVLMIDIDFFKNTNDSHGHLYGDEVLKNVAKSISGSLRRFDFLGRYGGEEFIVLITHMNKEDGLQIAERIRKDVESLKHRYGKVITISIGLTAYERNDSMDSIVDRADRCLYEAKETGRNKVVSDIA